MIFPVEEIFATALLEDLKEYFFVSLAPPAFTVIVLPAETLDALAFSVSFCAALLILKVFITVPRYLLIPVIFAVAVPTETFAEKVTL